MLTWLTQYTYSRYSCSSSINTRWYVLYSTVSWLRNASEAFITSVALLLRAAIYPPMETIDGTTFHVVVRGVAIKDMMVKCSGMIWGLDMVLANKELRHLSPAIALTYCELMLLPRNIFMKLLENFPLEKRKVRRASIWLAFRRKFLKHAREVELLSDQIQTMLQRDATEHKLSVRGQFEKYDTAGDGNLTFLQLNEALVNLGFQASPDVIQNIIARFDTNSDGKVSLDEFFDFFSVSSDKKNDKPKRKFHRQRSSLVNISNATETIFEVNENEKHDEVKDSIASNNNKLGNNVHVNNATIEQLAKRFDASLYNSEKRLNDKLKAMQNEIQEALLKINNAQCHRLLPRPRLDRSLQLQAAPLRCPLMPPFPERRLCGWRLGTTTQTLSLCSDK